MPLPKFRNRLWKFLVLFCLCYFLETITFTYLISAVESIERQFQIPSRLSGTLVASSDIGYILTVVVLAHFGSKGNRARWIGSGCLLISFACLLVALPSFIFPPEATLQRPIANVTLEAFQLPQPLLQYAEVDSPGKLFSHPHMGCAFTGWLRTEAIQLPHIWNVSDSTLEHYRSLCSNANMSLAYVLPPVVTDHLKLYINSEYEFGNLVNAFVDRINAVGLTESDAVLGNRQNSLRLILRSPQAICSRIGSALRSFMSAIKCESKSTNDIAFSMVLAGIMLIGVGHSMPWTLGMPLIDDNVKKRHMPFYMAGVFFIRILGPVLGFMVGGICSRLYYNLSIDPRIDPSDVNWIGAWWLGFLVVFALLLFPSLLLICFPYVDLKTDRRASKEGKAAAKNAERRIAANESRKFGSGVVQELSDFGSSVAQILRSPVYSLTLLGRMLDALAFKGFFVFHPKYLQANFGIPQYKAVISMGLLGTVGFAAGSLFGSYIMRKFKLDGRRAVVFIGCCALLSIIFNFVKMAIGCNSVLGSLAADGRLHGFNFSTSCNMHCQCDQSMLYPVCSSSGMTYFSPCHAGCYSQSDFKDSSNFTNCFCIDTGSTVSRDYCRDDCSKPLMLYFFVMCVAGFIGGCSVVPGVLIVLRSVPIHQRSVALGFSGFLISLLSTFPSPIVYGYVIDQTCLLWSENCGQKGSCSIYDSEQLRIRYFALHGCLRISSLLFDIGVFYFAKNLKLMEEDEEKEADNGNAPSIEPETSENTLEKQMLAVRTEAEEMTCCTNL